MRHMGLVKHLVEFKPDAVRHVAHAICKSVTCEGINCCQYPSNGGHRRDSRGQPVKCMVDEGAYDDAAVAALTAVMEKTL